MVNYDLPWSPMRVPQSWEARITQRILESLEVIQHTMTFAGLNEDYREMLLGEVAKRIEPGRLFLAMRCAERRFRIP